LTEKSRNKKILVCPLDWGLGHAARDVAIVKQLTDLGHEVILAAGGGAIKFLVEEFPELETVRFGSLIRIRYSRRLPAWMKITLLSPLLLYEVFAEHLRLKRLVRKLRPDVVISDNRYGLWNQNVTSVLVTHQLSIQLPMFASFLELPAFLAMRTFISQFDHCWIPDFPGKANLSGDLSHRFPLPGNAVFIGAISRFTGSNSNFAKSNSNTAESNSGFAGSGHGNGIPTASPVDLLILLSGPEPQRSRLQKIVLKQVLSLKAKCVILQGLPGKLKRTDLTSTVTMYNHLPSGELRKLLLASEHVICRSGYTSIMDLALLKKKALILPTPDQIEQEYLAGYLAGKGLFKTCAQDELDLESAIEDLRLFEPDFDLPSGDSPVNDSPSSGSQGENLLGAAIKRL
jgi:UDP:flavonoid glycosyltransferase YjiC (YdhE family)